jgi:hypothetical protein
MPAAPMTMVLTLALGTVSDMRILLMGFASVAVSMLLLGSVHARQYTSQDEFLASAFTQVPATRNLLWLTDEMKTVVTGILGHPYPAMRIRYWMAGERIAWVLDEVGKEEPITVGVVTERNRVGGVTILAFRESRGGEVRYDSFTRQFIGAGLDESYKLDNNIDGITGATLSVWAVTRVTELALYLSLQVSGRANPESVQAFAE